MIISIKDAIKFLGIIIVCFCASFVCTFSLNYYLDVLPLESEVFEEIVSLYKAQVAMSKMVCGITGGVLVLIAVIMLIFYIKIYIDTHSKQIGIFKAMGYSNAKISANFLFFGISTFVGTILGFAVSWASMPFIYGQMQIEGMSKIPMNFHSSLVFIIIIAPTTLFSLLSFAFGYIVLNKPPLELINGKSEKIKISKRDGAIKERSFLFEMGISSLKSKKLLVFFVTFASFCFAAMVQMGLSMENLVSGTMGFMILIIGLVLAVTASLMSFTSLTLANAKNISIMKAFGYNLKDCFKSLFIGFLPFLALGFVIGTGYQYALLFFMVNFVFKDVGEVPSYSFNVPVMFFTLALIIVFYLIVGTFYYLKIKRISVKEVMLDE